MGESGADQWSEHVNDLTATHTHVYTCLDISK